MPRLRVVVPATSANLGPGFDCLGIALGLCNELELSWSSAAAGLPTLQGLLHPTVVVEGEGAEELAQVKDHLVLAALGSGLRALGEEPGGADPTPSQPPPSPPPTVAPPRPPSHPPGPRPLSRGAQSRILGGVGTPSSAGVLLRQTNRIPLARGLGSSATAVVAGLAAAQALHHLKGSASGLQVPTDRGAGPVELPLHRVWLLEQASLLEGHPDNAAPAIYGGLTIAWMNTKGQARCIPLTPGNGLALVTVWPDLRVATHAARQVMPEHYPRHDVAFSLGRLALLMEGLHRGDLELLATGIEDLIHTPYRKPLIPGYDEMVRAVNERGGAVFISGSGPTVGAFVPLAEAAFTAEAMQSVFATHHLASSAHWESLASPSPGVRVTFEP